MAALFSWTQLELIGAKAGSCEIVKITLLFFHPVKPSKTCDVASYINLKTFWALIFIIMASLELRTEEELQVILGSFLFLTGHLHSITRDN